MVEGQGEGDDRGVLLEVKVERVRFLVRGMLRESCPSSETILPPSLVKSIDRIE